MSLCRRVAALVIAAALGLPVQGAVAQSISIRVSSLQTDSMPPGPVISVTGLPASPDGGPYSIMLLMSTEPSFQSPFYVGVAQSLDSAFTTDSLLTEHTTIFLRAQLISRKGDVVAQKDDHHPVLGWVRLIDPPQKSLVVLPTKKPRFVWSSPPTTLSAGFWQYQLRVINKATNRADFESPFIDSTSYIPGSLESNASYRWQVIARAFGGKGRGEDTVTSSGTIIIGGDPTFTLLYQNFPNPFSRGQITCFWFDLATPARVKLTIYDIRLRHVRSIVPGAIGDGVLPIGVYGRDPQTQVGCDPSIAWDGRDDNGRFVPAGVYIAEFRANGSSTTKKILYRGP